MIQKLLAASLFLAAFTALGQEFSERGQRYYLQPSDVLELRYRYTPEFNETVTVSPDGFATFQLAGDVEVGNLTVAEAQDRILEKVSTRLRDPELVISLKEFEKRHFVVAGHVEEPGRFDMRGKMTALQGIAIAGGFTEKAKHSQVVLYRRIGPDTAEAKLLDMKQMMKPDGLQEDVELRSGDMLVVPQNRISKIERIIRGVNFGWGLYIDPARWGGSSSGR